MTNARISIKQKLESAISDNPEDFENIVLALEDICEGSEALYFIIL